MSLNYFIYFLVVTIIAVTLGLTLNNQPEPNLRNVPIGSHHPSKKKKKNVNLGGILLVIWAIAEIFGFFIF